MSETNSQSQGFTDSSSIDSLNIRFALENDTANARQEIIGVGVGFPDSNVGCYPANVSNYALQLTSAEERLGVGDSTNVNGGTQSFSYSLRWPASALGNGVNNVRIKTTVWNWPNTIDIELVDNGTGGFQPNPYITSGTINYNSGAIALVFGAQRRPTNGSPITVTYNVQSSVSTSGYPTQWQVMRVWPSGRVRLAKAWIGEASGVGVRYPAKTSFRIVSYLKLIYDPNVNTLLPTWAPHAEVLAATNNSSSFIASYVYDSNNNAYVADAIDSPGYSLPAREAYHYENDVLQDPANTGGKGWMKVIRRRGYHRDLYTSASSIDRDFLSLTSYLYLPHGDRKFDVEMRLGNDYQGSDPYEHSTTLTWTANGSQTTFSSTFPDALADAPGNIRKGRVTVTAGTSLSLEDRYGDGSLYDSGEVVRGTVNYGSGAISFTPGTLVSAGTVISATAKHCYYRVGTGNGSTTTFTATLPIAPSQFSMHIRAGAVEGKDTKTAAGTLRVGSLIPYFYTPVYSEVGRDNGTLANIVCDGTTTSYVIQLQNTNIVPTTVQWRVATEEAYEFSGSQFGRDLPDGSFQGRISSATFGPTALAGCSMNYAAGELTLSFTGNPPPLGARIVVDYGYCAGSTLPVTGTINYSTRQISVTFATAPANNVPVLVSYIKNDLNATFNSDPNMHPLGPVGFYSWSLFTRNYTDPAAGFKGPITDQCIEAINNNMANAGVANPIAPYGTSNYIIFARGKLDFFVERQAMTLSSGNIAHTLTGTKPVNAGSVTIQLTIAGVTYVARDNGAGSFTGLPGTVTTNTISYATGVVTIDVSGTITAAYASYSYFNPDGAVIPGGGNNPIQHEYMTDGSAIPRTISFYCGTSASGTENTAWAAKKAHVLQLVPTTSAYNIRAYGLHEGTVKFNIPPINLPIWQYPKMYVNKELLRDETGKVNQHSGGGSLKNLWGEGGSNEGFMDFEGGAGVGTQSRGVRGTCGSAENKVSDPGSSGAPRSAHDRATKIYLSEARQAVRVGYYQTMFQYYRPGHTLWGFVNTMKRSGRTYYKFVSANAYNNGLIQNNREDGSSYLVNSQEWLNRAYRNGFGYLTCSVTRNSTRVYFQHTDLFYNLISYTYVGANSKAGHRRIRINGSNRVYNVLETGGNYLYFDNAAGKWYVDLTTPWQGNTVTNAVFATMTDPEPGTSRSLLPNDPRWYPTARLGCGIAANQHGISSDVSSHHACAAAFDIWEITGSWMLWDRLHTESEVFIGNFKTPFATPFNQYHGQTRETAWWLRCMLLGYHSTAYLAQQPGFSFLDSPWGTAPARYKDAIVTRMAWWLDIGARAQMDPLGHIAKNGKEKLNDCHVFDGIGLDFFPGNVGGTSPTVGGNGTLTEAQVKFGQFNFAYWPVWMTGYMLPYMWAAWREFRNDTNVVSMPFHNETDSVGNILYRLCIGTSNALMDYGVTYGSQWTSQRNEPGFVSMHIAGRFGKTTTVYGPTNPAPSSSGLANMFPIKWNTTYSQFVATTTPPINFPAWTEEDYAIPNYYVRGPSDHNSYPSSLKSVEDKWGHPIPGVSITTFEDGVPFGGEPFGGFPTGEPNTWTFGAGGVYAPALFNPAANDPNSNLYRGTRAPNKPESVVTLGAPFDGAPNPLNANFALSFYWALRFHSSQARRDQAAKLLNGWIYQMMARTLMFGGAFQSENFNPATGGTPIDGENYMLGPVTGDFPHVAGSTGLLNRWWDNAWTRRRKLSTDVKHSTYVGGVSIVSVTTSVNTIVANAAQQNGTDIRVVYQKFDGTDVVLSHTLRRNVTGDYTLYFKPVEDIVENTDISVSEDYAYYVYYRNSQATNPVPWSNTTNSDGPFSSDTDTVVLWNFDGSLTVDNGPYGFALSTIANTEPDFVDGPFSGAASFVRTNFDLLYSPYVSLYTPPASFSIEFKCFITTKNLLEDAASMWVLNSNISDTQFPWLIYKEANTNAIIGRFSLGSGQAFIPSILPMQALRSVIVGTGNGVTTTFSFSFPEAVDPSKLAIYVEGNNNASFVDPKSQSGAYYRFYNVSTPSLNYNSTSYFDDTPFSSWLIDIVFTSAVPNGKKVYVLYSYASETQRLYAPDRWNAIRYVYNQNVGVTCFLNGVQAAFNSASGGLEPYTTSDNLLVGLGCVFTQSSLFQYSANCSIAEYRLSSTARTVDTGVIIPTVTTPLLEERIIGEDTKDAACVSYIASQKTKVATSAAHIATGASASANAAVFVYNSNNVAINAACATYVVSQFNRETNANDVTSVAVTRELNTSANVAVQVVNSLGQNDVTSVATTQTVVASTASYVQDQKAIAAACVSYLQQRDLELRGHNTSYVMAVNTLLVAPSGVHLRTLDRVITATNQVDVLDPLNEFSLNAATYVKVNNNTEDAKGVAWVQATNSLDKPSVTYVIIAGSVTAIDKTYVQLLDQEKNHKNVSYILEEIAGRSNASSTAYVSINDREVTSNNVTLVILQPSLGIQCRVSVATEGNVSNSNRTAVRLDNSVLSANAVTTLISEKVVLATSTSYIVGVKSLDAASTMTVIGSFSLSAPSVTRVETPNFEFATSTTNTIYVQLRNNPVTATSTATLASELTASASSVSHVLATKQSVLSCVGMVFSSTNNQMSASSAALIVNVMHNAFSSKVAIATEGSRTLTAKTTVVQSINVLVPSSRITITGNQTS